MNEPWRVVTNDPCIGIWGGENMIADLTDMNIPWEEKLSIANRIVLCVNACAGMSDEALRRNMDDRKYKDELLDMFSNEINTLKSQLDEVMKFVLSTSYSFDLGLRLRGQELLDRHKASHD